MDRLKFSLVTTCRNEMRSFARWKNDILEQTRPPDEIVVVDAFSDDGTAENLLAWGAEDKRLVVIQEKGAAAHGRNVAIEHARYEHILSTDMGVRLAKVWCEELIKPFESDPAIEVVAGGTQIDLESIQSATARAEYYIENGGLYIPGPGFVIGNRSSAYLKHVWRELGGLPEDLTFYSDDSVFGRQILQAGYRMAFAPKAMTYWARPSRLKQFWKESFNYGRGGGEANIKKPYVVKLWEKGVVPTCLAPWLNGCRALQDRAWGGALWRALKSADAAAILMMPALCFGKGYWFARGYLEGLKKGSVACSDCRRRLSPEYRI